MKAAMTLAGLMLALTGTVWALQGADLVGGSAMTGQTRWLAIGVACAVVGLALMAMGRSRRRP